VLLPSDTHRKPLTFNTAVLFPFVTYFLTLPHTTRRYKPEYFNILERQFHAKVEKVSGIGLCETTCVLIASDCALVALSFIGHLSTQ
jgi:hypothetical protein